MDEIGVKKKVLIKFFILEQEMEVKINWAEEELGKNKYELPTPSTQ